MVGSSIDGAGRQGMDAPCYSAIEFPIALEKIPVTEEMGIVRQYQMKSNAFAAKPTPGCLQIETFRGYSRKFPMAWEIRGVETSLPKARPPPATP